MRRLWRWEMIQLTNDHNDLTIADLSTNLARQQNMAVRLRGWMSLVKRRGFLRGIPRWPRWMKLAFHSTPRYLVYQAAAEVAFRLPCLVKHSGQLSRLNVRWRDIQALLPEQAPQSNSCRDAIWRELVDDVLWNIRSFCKTLAPESMALNCKAIHNGSTQCHERVQSPVRVPTSKRLKPL